MFNGKQELTQESAILDKIYNLYISEADQKSDDVAATDSADQEQEMTLLERAQWALSELERQKEHNRLQQQSLHELHRRLKEKDAYIEELETYLKRQIPTFAIKAMTDEQLVRIAAGTEEV